jgi:hypothetical protein
LVFHAVVTQQGSSTVFGIDGRVVASRCLCCTAAGIASQGLQTCCSLPCWVDGVESLSSQAPPIYSMAAHVQVRSFVHVPTPPTRSVYCASRGESGELRALAWRTLASTTFPCRHGVAHPGHSRLLPDAVCPCPALVCTVWFSVANLTLSGSPDVTAVLKLGDVNGDGQTDCLLSVQPLGAGVALAPNATISW